MADTGDAASLTAGGASTSPTFHREPTTDQLAQMVDLASVLRWAKLTGDLDHPPSMAGSLAIALGGGAAMEIEEAAALDEHVVNRIVNSWAYSESLAADDDLSQEKNVEPSEFIKMQVRSAHNACRILSNMVVSRAAKRAALEQATAETNDYRAAKLQRMDAQADAFTQSQASAVALTAAATSAGPMVAMNEVADTTQVRSIPVIDPKAYLSYYKNFEKWMLRKPNPGEVPSKAQLTCLIEILKSGTCYVDLAIFGEHQCRSAVAMKCSGRAIGPGGVIQPMVFRGPDCYTTFRAGWDVYNASMTMLEECIPQWTEQYGNRIRDLDKLFGPKLWAFLYQSHVRFWSEHMPGAMLMKANDQLEALVTHDPNYKPVDGPNGYNYNPAKPWAWLF